MSSINKKKNLIIILSIVVLLIALLLKNFAFLLFGLTLSTMSIAAQFPNKRVTFTPIISFMISITIAEGALNYFSKNPYLEKKSNRLSSYHKNIKGFGYLPTKGEHAFRKVSTSGEIIYDVIYSIGEDGYRKDLSNKEYDLYIYGGSFTFGEGLNDDETLSSYLLEDHLINSKNLGVHGFGLNQALYNIENGITSKQGINILLTFPSHALRSSCKPYYSKGTPLYTIKDGLAILDGSCDKGGFITKVIQKSQIYLLIKQAFFNTENIITDDDIELYLAIIKTIQKETNKNGSKLLVAFIVNFESSLMFSSWTNDSILKSISDISDLTIDVTLSDRREELDNEFYLHNDDMHPSAKANKERARLIAQYLNTL